MRCLALTAVVAFASAAAAASGLSSCLDAASVPYSSPSSPHFMNQSSVYNINAQFVPVLVAVPTTPKQVSSALKCAAAQNVTAQPKGGGHSFAGYGSGGKNGALMIDMESFQDIEVYANGTAKVGGGVRLGNLALSLYKQGKRAMPHGSCSGVGIGGHSTHGGYGYASRTWGLTLDTILAMDFVFPNGTIAHASPDINPDLFFALRGAADSFGVITTFYTQTYPAPESLINYTFSFKSMFNGTNSSAATTALLHMQDFARNASVLDSKHGLGTYLDAENWMTSGSYMGSLNYFNNVIKPEFLRGFPPPDDVRIQVVNWTDNLAILAGEPLATPLPGYLYSEHDDFFAKSIIVPEAAVGNTFGVSADAAKAYFDYIRKYGAFNQTSGWYTIFDLYGGTGSQVNVPSSNSSAFPHRNTLWVFQHYGYAYNFNETFPSDIHPFIEGLNSAIPNAQPQTIFNSYINYQDPSLSPKQAHKVYYGDKLYKKLAALKKVVDPKFVLWNPQAIGTS